MNCMLNGLKNDISNIETHFRIAKDNIISECFKDASDEHINEQLSKLKQLINTYNEINESIALINQIAKDCNERFTNMGQK
mgnify:FL=1